MQTQLKGKFSHGEDQANAEYRHEDVFLSSEPAANIAWVSSDHESTSWTGYSPLTDSKCEPVISHTVLLYPVRRADLQRGEAWLASSQFLHVQREALLWKSYASDPVFTLLLAHGIFRKEEALTHDTNSCWSQFSITSTVEFLNISLTIASQQVGVDKLSITAWFLWILS